MERRKLAAETERIEAETRDSTGFRGLVGVVAAPLTGIAAILAIGVSLVGLWREQSSQRRQREDAQRQQTEQKFAGALLGLGSEQEGVQAGAAVSMLTFLEPRHEPLHAQARWAILANLKVKHSRVVRRLLVHAFEKAMRGHRLEPEDLDLSEAFLGGADLRGLSLEGAQMEAADLTDAQLGGTNLRNAEGIEVILVKALLTDKADLLNARFRGAKAARANFGGANLVNAHLEEGDFVRAVFAGSRLQAAHLEDADLRGARFEGANLADTYFLGATLDRSCLETIAKAENWTKAHFDPATLANLEAIARGGN
jgi:uncharacterized protein YjbI with pentapeptide repeats